MKIKDVTNKLAKIRAEYQAAYQKAAEEKEAGMKRLNSDFIPNSESYMKEKGRVEFQFQVDVVKAQAKAAKEGGEEIEALRQQELSGIGRIDADAMSRVNSLRGIPLTSIELQAVLDKYGANYWTQRAVSALAEENGISVSDLNGLPASIDVRMSVLSQLEDQLNTMLTDYDLTSRTNEATRARFLYLNDDILERSCKIFDNRMNDISDGDAAARAAATIHAMSGEMSRGVAISNSLRNLKGKSSARNELLYRLASDTTISDAAFTVAGVDAEIREWKQGKAARYAESVKLSHDLAVKTDVEDIKNTIRTYQTHLTEAGQQENPFLESMLKSASKTNSAVGSAIAEMNGVRMVDATTTDTE